MFNWLKIKTFNYLTKNVLTIVRQDKVLSTTREGVPLLNSQQIKKEDLSRLKQEALFFEKSLLYSVLTNTVKHQAQKNLFEKSTSLEDMRYNKAALWVVDIQEKIVDALTKEYKK